MTKKEQKQFDEALKSARESRSLCWPCVPEPNPVDIKAELHGKPCGTLYVGWWFHVYLGLQGTPTRFGKGCTDGIHHSKSRTDRTDAQTMGRFYASRKDAILAARWELCRQIASILAALDLELYSEYDRSTDESPKRPD